MKKTLLFSILLYYFTATAQGPQQLVDVQMDSWPGATVKGWLYLPADYATSTKNYPVVFFYHGVGEAGTNPYLLLNQGIPNLIANGMRPDNITNPVDGKKYSFIVVSAQHWSWSPNPTWLPYEVAWLKQNYRIDTNRIYVTGLSAGGQTSFSTTIVNDDVSRLIAAAAPMSPAQVWPYDPSLIGQNKIKTWFFSGNVDGSYTVNATNYSNDCNTLYPTSSKLNIYSGGHCCWNNFYTTAWHDPSTGLSIWEWMLTNERQMQSILPVKFVSFDVVREGSTTQFTWKVAEQENVLTYEIEKSSDSRTFTKIGEVKAAPQTEYRFTDNQSPANFYRIKSVDVDGKYSFSTILRYNGSKASVLLKVFPTVVQNQLTVQHPTAMNATRITISTSDGKALKISTPDKGMQQTILDLSSFKSGLYFVKYEDANGIIETTKIVKQ
jgi:dienelactone hydrolase